MKIKFDKKADSVYISLTKKSRNTVKQSIPIENDNESYMILLDFDKNNKLIGIDIMAAKKTVDIDSLKKLMFEEV